MKKYFWSFLLTMAAALFLVSCGGSDDDDDPVMGSKPDPVYKEGEAIKADGAELSWLISNSPVIFVNSVFLNQATRSEKQEFESSFADLCNIAEHFKLPEDATRGWLGISADIASFCEHLGKPAAKANQELYQMLRQVYGKSGEEELNKKLWNMSREYVPTGYDFVDFTKDIASGDFNHPGLLGKIYVDETFLMKLEDYSMNMIRQRYLAETTSAVAEDAMSIVMDAAPGDIVGVSATTYKLLKAVQEKKKGDIVKVILSAVDSDIDDLYNLESLKNSVESMIDISEQKHFDYPVSKSLFTGFYYQELETGYVWVFFDPYKEGYSNKSDCYTNYGEDYSCKTYYTTLSGEHFYIKRGDHYDAYDIIQTLGTDYKEISIKMWKAGTYNPMEYMTLMKYEIPADIIGTWHASYTEDDEYGYFHEEVDMTFEKKGKFTIDIKLKFDDENGTSKISGNYRLDGDRVNYTITKVVEDGVDLTDMIEDSERTGTFIVDIEKDKMTITNKNGALGDELSNLTYTRKK